METTIIMSEDHDVVRVGRARPRLQPLLCWTSGAYRQGRLMLPSIDRCDRDTNGARDHHAADGAYDVTDNDVNNLSHNCVDLDIPFL